MINKKAWLGLGIGAVVGLAIYLWQRGKAPKDEIGITSDENRLLELEGMALVAEIAEMLRAEGKPTYADALVIESNNPEVIEALEAGKTDLATSIAFRAIGIHVADIPIEERPDYVQKRRAAVDNSVQQLEAYKVERDRVASVIPEATGDLKFPMSSSLITWAHKIDSLGGAPTPAGEYEILKEAGYGYYFSPEAKDARRIAAELRLVARQPTSAGAAEARNAGVSVSEVADALTARANAMTYEPGCPTQDPTEGYPMLDPRYPYRGGITDEQLETVVFAYLTGTSLDTPPG